jgi:esterase/lipase
MKIIVTKEQHKIIKEALGVPDSILDAAEELYDMFADNLNSITYKESSYEFRDDIDVVLGDKKKIMLDEYTLDVEIEEVNDFHERVTPDRNVVISSMAMSQQFRFNRDTMMKEIPISTSAGFNIVYYASPEWKPQDLYDEFIREKSKSIGSLAHELKHKYDKQAKRIDLIGKDAEYIAVDKLPSFHVPEVDDQFVRYLYFTDGTEDLVRTTEVASNMRSEGISKSQFREFLQNNKTFKTLVDIKNFTFEKLIKGIYDNLDTVNEIFDAIDVDTDGMSDKDKVEKFLKIIYVNLSNMKLRTFEDYVGSSENMFAQFLRVMGQLGIADDEEEIKLNKIKSKFQNHVLKYRDKPIQFFKSEIDRFHKVSDQAMKRISKLYAMAKDDTEMTESIIDWELHRQLMEKKHGKLPIETDFKFISEDRESKIENIKQLIKDPNQFETIIKMMGIENLIKIVYDGDIIKFSEGTTTPLAYMSADRMDLYLHAALVEELGLNDLTWSKRNEKELGKFRYGSKNSLGYTYAFNAVLYPTRLHNQNYYRVVGTSGDSGFGYGFISKKNTLGVRHRQQIFKQIIDKYDLTKYMEVKTFY